MARINEVANLGTGDVRFIHSDLFDGLDPTNDAFDVILFNPPGWQTPSAAFLQALQRTESAQGLSIEAMFYGDRTLKRFFDEVPLFLKPGAKLIIGLNSLVGIPAVMHALCQKHEADYHIDWCLLERHEFPLMLYTQQWRQLQGLIHEEIVDWTRQGAAYCRFNEQGDIIWSYEILELTFSRRSIDGNGQ
ncbi:hypothetical protein [Pseudomonas frederiksbergensis]|uniref:hypothetical protein n=1 Tax=Pseudomonas frederiksbergensis TaxID=104087 RepID=UPI003D1EB812